MRACACSNRPEAGGRDPAQEQRSPPGRFSLAQRCAEVFEPALDFKALLLASKDFLNIMSLSAKLNFPLSLFSPTNYTGLNLLQF